MIVKFFLYLTKNGKIILLLSDLPDNIDFEESGSIYFNGEKRLSGIKWKKQDGSAEVDNIKIFYSESGVELEDDVEHKYIYDGEEITIDPKYKEIDI
jgi:hypothetical protein